MEKKTMDTLRTMICGELEDIAKKGSLSHETLDILKDLLDSAKNLEKIEKYQSEKEEKEMGMDMSYSQRKYYIDADYDPYKPMNSYARGGQGNSYARNMYDMGGSYMDGNSYMYDPRYDMPMYSMARGNSYARGYSRHGDKQEMINELQEMMNEAQDMKVKEAIQKALNEMK
jgi:hypothetical protein